MKAARIFFILSVAFGLLFAVVTPPFQVPDESTHFYRSYSIARGALRSEIDRGRVGDELPVSIIQTSNAFTRTFAGRPEVRIDPSRITSQLDRRVIPLESYFEHFPASSTYPPVPYVPQAVAIAFATLMEASPLELLYAARISVVLVTSALLTWAIAITPILRWQIAFIALLPMAMSLRASASADAMTISLSFLAIAAIFRLAFGPDPSPGPRAIAPLLGSALLLPLTKGGYALIALLSAIVPPGRLRRPIVVFALILIAVLAGFALALPWGSSALAQSSSSQGSDASEQMSFAVQHPLKTSSVIARDLVAHAPRYLAHFIGRLGLLDTPLPLPLLGAYAMALLGMLLTSDGEPSAWQRAIALGVFLLLTFGMTFALYAAWSPVGADHVEGVQGRYFLPFAPALFLVAANHRFSEFTRSRWWIPAFVTFQVVALTLVLGVLCARYYD